MPEKRQWTQRLVSGARTVSRKASASVLVCQFSSNTDATAKTDLGIGYVVHGPYMATNREERTELLEARPTLAHDTTGEVQYSILVGRVTRVQRIIVVREGHWRR